MAEKDNAMKSEVRQNSTPGIVSVLRFFSRAGLCPELEERTNMPSGCYAPEKPPKRPDPSQYSQMERFNSGQGISYDSPDIITNQHNSGLWPSIDVTVRNLSADAPAVGVHVRLDYSRYGIGFPMSELFSMSVDLNRSGVNGAEKKLSYPTPQWLRDEHQNIAVRATISHPHDRKNTNNIGEQAYSGSRVEKGTTATFDFDIYNSTGSGNTFVLYVQESDWNAQLSETHVQLMPGQSKTITLSLQVPQNETNNKSFNVIAMVGNRLYGGIFHNFDID
ncbi:MAG: hypothetical protein OQK78_05835 [Gammaproteobacteria bacterium]|nr:hypothetical protein [Gammaproteobacteria bacterium]